MNGSTPVSSVTAGQLIRVSRPAGLLPRIHEAGLIANHQAATAVWRDMAGFLRTKDCTAIIAKTSRGLIPGAAVADLLNLPLLAAGKSGKMPGKFIYIAVPSADGYQGLKDYVIERELLHPGDRLGLVDNVMHSGKTLAHIGDLLINAARAEIPGVCPMVRYPHLEQAAWFSRWFQEHGLYSPFCLNESGELTGSLHDAELPVPLNFQKMSLAELKNLIHIHPHFPKSPVMWTNYNQILASPPAYKTVTAALAEAYTGQKTDVVMSIGVRGFYWGTWLANRLGVGQVLTFRPEKLDGPIDQVGYSVEYNPLATMAIPRNSFPPGARVLIVDDILATGGTARAAWQLARQQHAEVVGLACVIGLPAVMQASPFFRELSRQCQIFTLLDFQRAELEEKFQARLASGEYF